MASKVWPLSGAVIVLVIALNLAGCAQTGPPPTGAATLGGAYRQEQKAIWVDPQGSGESTDMELYMDSQGGGR
jgi:hypothetical protein